MANKKTQREFFNDIIVLAEANNRGDIVEFAKGRIDALDRKSTNRKNTKTQEANEAIKATIVDTLRTIGSGTVTEIQGANTELAGYSNQKISALLRQMYLAKIVDKSTEKKVSRFSLMEGV